MVEKSKNAFRTISEVADIIDVPAHVLRFWESKFTQIKPVKRGGGRRYYRPNDIYLIRGIRDLLYSDGLTIKGAQKVLREKGTKNLVARGETAMGEGAPAPIATPDDAAGDAGDAPATDDIAAQVATFVNEDKPKTSKLDGGKIEELARDEAPAPIAAESAGSAESAMDPSAMPFMRKKPRATAPAPSLAARKPAPPAEVRAFQESSEPFEDAGKGQIADLFDILNEESDVVSNPKDLLSVDDLKEPMAEAPATAEGDIDPGDFAYEDNRKAKLRNIYSRLQVLREAMTEDD